ncbi:hypothetical protein [Actinomyces sp. HMT897]|nr:hypothetical protein [Actinomyces sp. HMT897]
MPTYPLRHGRADGACPAASTPRALTGSRRPRHAPAPGARRAA